MLLDRKVTGLVGSGTDRDPVRGVVLDDGRELRARWVLGADGQRSSVAHHLGLRAGRGAPGRAGDAARLLAGAPGLGLDPPGHARAVGVHGRSLRGRPPPAHGRRTGGPDPRHSRSPRGSLPPGAPGLPGGAEPAPARGRRAGLPGGRRTGDDDARLLPLRRGPRLGPRRRRRALQAPDHGPGHRRRPGPGRVRRRGPARRRRPGGVRAVADRAVHRGLRVLLPRGAAARAADRGPVRRAGSGPGRRPAVPGHVHPADQAVRRVHPRAVPALAGGGGVRGRPAPPGRAGRRSLGPGPADPGARLSPVVGARPRRPPVRGRRGLHPREVLRRSGAGLGRSRARRAAGGLDGRAGRGPP